jgi:hypothetical protein
MGDSAIALFRREQMNGTENNSWLRDRKVPKQGFGRWKADQSDVMRST